MSRREALAEKCEAHRAAGLDLGFPKCGRGSLSSDQWWGAFQVPARTLCLGVGTDGHPGSHLTPLTSSNILDFSGSPARTANIPNTPWLGWGVKNVDQLRLVMGQLGCWERHPLSSHFSCGGQNRGHLEFAAQLMWTLTLTHHLGALRP